MCGLLVLLYVWSHLHKGGVVYVLLWSHWDSGSDDDVRGLFPEVKTSPPYWGRIILSKKEVFSNPQTKVTDNRSHSISAPPSYPGVGLALQSYEWADEGYTLSPAGGEFTCSKVKDLHHEH